MKNGFLKIAASSARIAVGDVTGNCSACVAETQRAAELGAKLIVFPELCLTGASCGDLFRQSSLISAAERELERFMSETAEIDAVVFIGLPVRFGGNLYNAVAATHKGTLLGIVPKRILTSAEKRWFAAGRDKFPMTFAGQDSIFGADMLFIEDGDAIELEIGVAVGSEIFDIDSFARYHAKDGATVIVNPAYDPEGAGRIERRRELLISESRKLRCAVIRAESGIGESGTDGICSGASVITENGRVLADAAPFAEDGLICTETDLELLRAERIRDTDFESEDSDYFYARFELEKAETELTRAIPASPFIPEGEREREEQFELLFNIQSRALAERIKRARSTGAVIGVSGGLDSTLAVLVAARAIELCGFDKKRLIAVTMPCYGTTERTKGNAEKLSEALGADLRIIDIKAAVSQHFSDIGYDAEKRDVVYENAQARERTQVLMDIANGEGALVVGTGDLSELALGFATYNGDHMSMYGVNAAMPKTLMRFMVAHSADGYERSGRGEVAAVLRDVLATPVSPELLPPKDGEIAQCTEDIVGPYELHDFFLYYLLRYGFSPEKIARMAAHAFAGTFDPETVNGWLRIFLRRFFTQQFKRSCLPDGPALGSVSLSPRGGYVMPSDAAFSEWLK